MLSCLRLGFSTIIIETVGVGQDEIEIVRASHTTVVVSAPGLGDEIQAIKAGILEIADIHVVSKCDRSDANRTLTDLKSMLALGAATSVKPEWVPPVLGISSLTGEGVDALIAAVVKHRNIAFNTETGRRRQLAIADFRLRKTAENILLERFDRASNRMDETFAAHLAARTGDPYSLADELVIASLRKDEDERAFSK